MKTKTFAIISDIVLVAVVLGGAILLFASGIFSAGWNTDRPLLPLVVDWSRILILAAAVGTVLGVLVAALVKLRRDRLVDGRVVRYSGFDRIVHWALAIGFVLDFFTAIWLLRWLGLQSTPDIRPTLYLVHFIGATLIVLGATVFVAASRIRGQDALFPRWRDVGPAIARLFGYLGVYGESGVLGIRMPASWQKGWRAALAELGIKPAARESKFLSVEKVFSFTPLAILAFIVIATGLIKSARYFFGMPADLVYWTTWLHDLAAWLTVFVVGAHLAAIFLIPRNRPGIRTMIYGTMSFRDVEHEFPAWADEIREREPRTAPAEGVAAQGTVGD